MSTRLAASSGEPDHDVVTATGSPGRGRSASVLTCPISLSPSSLSGAHNPARDLAVPTLHLELSRLEDLLGERGLEISYETVRRWVLKFGPGIARKLRRCRPRPSDRWHLDEMVVRIPATGCTCGAPSIMRARFSTCWFSADATSELHSG